MSNTNTAFQTFSLKEIKATSNKMHTFSKLDGYTTIRNRETKQSIYFGSISSPDEDLKAMMAVLKDIRSK